MILSEYLTLDQMLDTDDTNQQCVVAAEWRDGWQNTITDLFPSAVGPPVMNKEYKIKQNIPPNVNTIGWAEGGSLF